MTEITEEEMLGNTVEPLAEEIQLALEAESEKLATEDAPEQPVDVSMEEVQASLMDISEIMLKQETRATKTQVLRERLLDNLTPVVMSMKISPNDKGWGVDDSLARTSILSEYRSLLNDMESSDKNLLNSRIKLKDIETAKNNGITAAEFFAQLKLHGQGQNASGTVVVEQPSQAEIESKLNKILDEGNLVISDSELTIGGNQLPREENDSEDQ